MEQEFFAEIVGQVVGEPEVRLSDDQNDFYAKVTIRVQQEIATSTGRRTKTLLLRAVTTDEAQAVLFREPSDDEQEVFLEKTFGDGDRIRIWSKKMLNGRPWWDEKANEYKAGRERFVIDHLEEAGDLEDLFRVEVTGRLASAPFMGSRGDWPFGHLQVMVNRRTGAGRDSRTDSELINARAYGARADWLETNLRRDAAVTVVSNFLVPGPLHFDKGAGDGGAQAVRPPLLNIVSVDLVPEEQPSAVRDAEAVRERQMLAGLTV